MPLPNWLPHVGKDYEEAKRNAVFGAGLALACGVLLLLLLFKPDLVSGALALVGLCAVGFAIEEGWKAWRILRRYR